MTTTMFSFRWSWQKLFSYGEVACFISAWAVGLLIATEGHQPTQDRTAMRPFAAASDGLGIQATLAR